MSLSELSVSDLGQIVTGKTPSTKNPAFFDGEYQFVTPSDLDWKTYYCQSTERTVTEDAKQILNNQFIPANTVMVTCIGNTIGKCGLSSGLCLTNQQINSIIPHDGIDSKFVYYLLAQNTDVIRGFGLGGGAATPILNKNAFARIKLRVPPKQRWANIASILSAYDELIQNNRRRIQLLEQAARILYKEWFVSLRFPGHEHTKIINGIPTGWHNIQVKELLSKIRRPGKIPMNEYLIEGSIPCVDQSREFIGGYTENKDALIDDLPMIVFGDHTRILKFIDFPFACGADGTQLILSNDPCVSQEYFFFSLDAIDLSNYFYARHFKFLKDQFVLRPPDTLIQQFTDIVKPIMIQIRLLRHQNHPLSKARDILLPKLMNGEIAV